MCPEYRVTYLSGRTLAILRFCDSQPSFLGLTVRVLSGFSPILRSSRCFRSFVRFRFYGVIGGAAMRTTSETYSVLFGRASEVLVTVTEMRGVRHTAAILC